MRTTASGGTVGEDKKGVARGMLTLFVLLMVLSFVTAFVSCLNAKKRMSATATAAGTQTEPVVVLQLSPELYPGLAAHEERQYPRQLSWELVEEENVPKIVVREE